MLQILDVGVKRTENKKDPDIEAFSLQLRVV